MPIVLPSTAQFTASLPSLAVLSSVFLLALLTYKIIRILASILITNAVLSVKEEDEIRKMAKWGLIGKFAAFIVVILSSCLKIASAFFQTIFFVFYSFIPIIVLGFVIMIVHQRWGDSAMMVTSILNDPNSTVSQSIHYLVRVPLQVLDSVAFHVIPVYNFLIFLLVHIPIEFFSTFVFGDASTLVGEGISYFARSISLLVQEVSNYVRMNRIDCTTLETSCINYTSIDAPFCAAPDRVTMAAICLDVSQRQFDSIPFMTSMMKGITCILKAFAVGCESMELIVNLFSFPFTDPSLWEALHNLLNSVLYIFIGAPTATAARCSLAGGFSVRPSLCTPDFAPVFDYAVTAMHAMGQAMDNFFDMVYLLIVYGNNAECPSGQLTHHSLFLPVWQDPLIHSLFGSNTTVLVTLSSSLFALTDGQHSVYIAHRRKVERSYFPNAWGSSAVNPRFGIASVKDKTGDTAMFGCKCIDDEPSSRMLVQCSTSSSGPQTANTYAFNSTWEFVGADRFMQCATVRIIVQSIRWPEGRVLLSEKANGGIPPLVVPKLVADAAVYVIPTCGGNSNILSCLDSRIFTPGNCYPFCMALHMRNLGAQPLLFRSYSSWRDGVLITDRDCVPMGSIPSSSSSRSNGGLNPSSSSSTCSSDAFAADTVLSEAATTNTMLPSNADGMRCNYNPICTSWVSNKTDLLNPSSSSGASYSASIPSFAETTQYVRHVLDGQPLVVAGGVIMRASQAVDDATLRYVDFPMLVGNQRNEFTIEVGSPAGIPVAPVPAVPRLSIANERKGFISLPPNYIEMVDIYNPSTLSFDTLWYAVNPSYDWMSCFAKYCATEGSETCVQLMMVSSYTAIRLWKVRYKDSACYIRGNDGVHVCRDDVAMGFALDPQMDLPILGSGGNADDVSHKLGGLCSGQANTGMAEFNLWVESMEYFDDFNIAVTVRRGSVKALYHLMRHVLATKQQLNVSSPIIEQWYKNVAGGGSLTSSIGTTIVYFVHTKNTSLIRPLEPWTSMDGVDPGFLPVVNGKGVLCPELRFLPSIGSFVAWSINSVILGIQMPVNFLSNLFALIETLQARAVGACPADPLGHSVLQDCGMGLFDLSKFFDAVQQGNQAFWEIVAWMGSLIRAFVTNEDSPLISGNTALKYFESFISGVAVYGEAGQIINLFQVTDIAESLLDTGIQDSVLGGARRRLFAQHDCPGTAESVVFLGKQKCLASTGNVSRAGQRRLLGTKQMSKRAGKGLLSGIMQVFTGGMKTIFSISRSLTDATTLAMTSADFGILLSTTSPTDIMGAAITAPGIVWAQFTYETILPMALDLASRILYSHTFPQSTAILWVQLHAAKDNFNKLIVPRLAKGCSGLRLMLGYSGGLPTAVYHNCIAASEMHNALFSLSVILFAEIPFYSCLCVQSSGNPFPEYILENCMEWVPAARKGMWQAIIHDSGTNATALCQWYGDYIHTTAMHLFDDWSMESHQAATSLASFLQDLLAPDAKNMGTCINTQSNVNTFVMLPIPSEHYHVCGKTSECKLRCADAFTLFYYELNRFQQLGYNANVPFQTFDVSIESPFFNPYQSTSASLYYIDDRIVALSSREPSSSYACSTCPFEQGGGCLVVAKTQWDTVSTFNVGTYCTPPPSNLKSTVYNAGGGGGWEFPSPMSAEGQAFALTYCNFALQDQELYVVTGYTSATMTMSSSGIFSMSGAGGKVITRQKLYATRYVTAAVETSSVIILDTEAISAMLLTPTIQTYVFEGVTVSNAYITECQINTLLEIHSKVKGKLVFFMTLMFSAQGWVNSQEAVVGGTVENTNANTDNNDNNNQQILKTGYITGMLSWCDPSVVKGCTTQTQQKMDFFLPCDCNVEGQVVCQSPSYTPGCRPHIDSALFLAQRGTFMHVKDATATTYLYLPMQDAVDSVGNKLAIQYVTLDPGGNGTFYPVTPPADLRFAGVAKQNTIRLFNPSSVTMQQLMKQELGSWSHNDVFALSGLPSRNVRSPWLLNATASAPVRWLQAAQMTSTAVQWLREGRIVHSNRGFEITSVASQKTTSQATLQAACSPNTCSACASASVRLLCHALQDCILSRCVGTIVNNKNILCSIGVVVEQLYLQMVTSWRAIYLFVVEISMFAIQGFGGSLAQNIVLSFPTDSFYSLVCACKDVFASFIAMGMSAVENVYGLFSNGRIDLSVSTQVTQQEAVHITQVRSIGGLIFNIVTDATLYPLLALHRWIMCITSSGIGTLSESSTAFITVQFGDLNMEKSWGVCSPLSDKLQLLMDSADIQNIMQNSVEGFVAFSMSLLSGIGETVLSGATLMYDSFIAFLEAIVWNIQNVVQAFNLRSCKVADYMQRIVLQCACGDTPYFIQATQRDHRWKDGAMWCSGSLALTLVDGSQGIIYNPYSLQQLSEALKGITQYINCLATSVSSNECHKPTGVKTLPILINQGVEPIAVWAKCKSNYMEQAWDIGAGALFTTSSPSQFSEAILDASLRAQARAWAQGIAPEFLQCMQSEERFYHDYSVCLRMYLNLTTGRQSNAYFLYTKEPASATEPPDACMVFSGLNASAQVGSPLQQTMQHCIMDESADPSLCPFNPTVWSAATPTKIPIAKMFGTLEKDDAQTIAQQYQAIADKLKHAFRVFNQTFLASAKLMQVALFSADGDFIHDFLDCVFLGPYTRVDLLPCDHAGDLECPYYARDENGGMDRNFTACFGSVMHGDGDLPFTCGSQTRRSLIKFFFRNFSLASNGRDLNSNITSLIQERITNLLHNLTDPQSFGCLDLVTGTCQPSACSQSNEYTPCLDMEFTISAQNVSKFLLGELLQKVDAYYALVMQDTAPWTTYYNVSKAPGQAPFPAQWGASDASAAKAAEYGHFKPMDPVLTYGPAEAYSMPLHEAPSDDRLEGSIWGLCMGLISQGQMSLPMNFFGEEWRPLGADTSFMSNVDWQNLESVASAVRNLTRKAADKSPFIWHKARRHAPSQSAMCKPPIGVRDKRGVGNRIRVGHVEFTAAVTEDSHQIPFPDNLSFPFHGFTWGMLGSASSTCLCGYEDPLLPDQQCMLSREACVQLQTYDSTNADTPAAQTCITDLKRFCTVSQGKYSKTQLPAIWQCLHAHLPRLRCPELGPSDSWGLFPMDCDGSECHSANQWGGNAQQDIIFEGIRLAVEGRGGLKLSNLQHVNATYHEAIDYTRQERPPSDYQIGKCFDESELSKDPNQDNDFDALQDWVKALVPAAQLHHDSPVVAYCSRFVVEVARAEALSFVSADASLKALQDARLWRHKCHAKIKHLTSCARMGVYYDVPPPPHWTQIYSKHCDVPLDTTVDAWGGQTQYFVTPWCIVINQRNRTMYDARICLRNAMTPQERTRLTTTNQISSGNGRALAISEINSACALPVQPLNLLPSGNDPSPFSSVYTTGAQRISAVEAMELSSLFDEILVQMYAEPTGYESISQVLDWWPSSVLMPVGFHVTAPMVRDELAPVAFDSHYAFDPQDFTLHYVHSALRDPNMLAHTLGAGGLCRTHSIGMPIFETNTNRVCTRMRKGALDSPHLPVDTPKFEADIPPVGPYSPTILAQKFEGERCAPSHEDVPWPAQDNPFDLAGSIPRISSYLRLNAFGIAYYYSSTTFPPQDAQLLPVKDMYRDWGEECAYAVKWDDSPTCYHDDRRLDPSLSNLNDCPRNTLCLSSSSSNATAAGICFSTAAFRLEKTRQPCFRSDHCLDGCVCLADGGCAPLYLHVWNAPANGIPSLEIGLLADDCGFQNQIHPFTQSMRGVSPWEQVPDLLHMHGLCSHRNWFTYRNALRDDVCPLSADDTIMQCNISEAVWPDVQMRFDGCSISQAVGSQRFTMAQQYSLHMVPHPCDTEYMHAALQQKRLKLCSGYQGIEKGAALGNYMRYDLNPDTATWEGITPTLLTSSPSAHWMRTYSETSDTLHVGGLQHAEKWDTRLGFLGAEYNASDPILADMADGAVQFFRCTERMACQMPEYTYGGATMDYRLDLAAFASSSSSSSAQAQVVKNYTETSLRRCGAIGSLLNEGKLDLCRLDVELFPLFAYILIKEEEEFVNVDTGGTITKGCFAIWPKAAFMSSASKSVVQIPFTLADVRQKVPEELLVSHASSLFCSTQSVLPLCVYMARASSVLTNANKEDHIATITDYLNSFIALTTMQVNALFTNTDARKAYESINLCSESLWVFTQQIQGPMQAVYNSTITSGLYVAFQLSLYEFPQQWFRQCLLTILLSHLQDSRILIPMPDTRFPTRSAPISLALWSSIGQTDYCAANAIRQRSGLYYMLCQEMHPDYTFGVSENNLAENIRAIIREEVMRVAHANMYEDQANASLECSTEVLWNCGGNDDVKISEGACRLALEAFYGADRGCATDSLLDICDNPGGGGIYTLGPLQLIPLSDFPIDSSGNLERFLTASIDSIVHNADTQFFVNDYVSEPWPEDNNDDFITLASVSGINTALFPTFVNTTQWMHQMCQRSILDTFTDSDFSSCAPSQADLLAAGKQCLFDEAHQYSDADRYFHNDTAAELIITFVDGTKEFVDVCTMKARVSSASTTTTNGDSAPSLLYYRYDQSKSPIQSVQVPPGVILRAYSAKDMDANSWKIAEVGNKLPNSNINCAWKSGPADMGDKDGWWPYAEGATFVSANSYEGFSSFQVDFGDMALWHTEQKDVWRSNGCDQMSTVYALEFRLESASPVFSPWGSAAYCEYTTGYPLTPAGYSSRRPSGPDACINGYRAFRVADGMKQNALWRCAPCTRYDPSILSNGFFDCSLPGRKPLQNLLTTEMLERSFDFLYSPSALQDLIQSRLKTLNLVVSPTVLQDISVVQSGGGAGLKVMLRLRGQSKWSHLENWGGTTRDCIGPLWACKWFEGYDPSNTLAKERILWNKAVNNPSLPFTMDCDGQKYSSALQQRCNPKTTKLLSKLSQFVDKQYRQTDGVWLPKVDQGTGLAWKANVAHSSVGMFTLFYTAGDGSRTEKEVSARWVLGQGPCKSRDSRLEDRICMESTRRSIPFEAMHPWLGGDFNPFQGTKGLDECPYLSSSTACTTTGRASGSVDSLVRMCPCACSPSWACEGTDFKYTQQYMESEFPTGDAACTLQEFSNVRIMGGSDDSNLCSTVRQTIAASRGCLTPQGLLGGVSKAGGGPVSATNLHSNQGVPSAAASSMLHAEELMDAFSESLQVVLWAGQKLPPANSDIPFLRMRRSVLHPAHIAFGLDASVTALPLIIQAIALLPTTKPQNADASWVLDLKRQWKSELYSAIEGNPEVKGIYSLYPQLDAGRDNSSNSQPAGRGDWSCPFRKFVFLAGNDNAFGPLIPNPVAAQAIYGMGGVHPFIKTQGPYTHLAPYFTVNGACFYREDPNTWPKIPVEDIENQCGLRGMLHLLVNQQESLTSVQESFAGRCNDIIDVPDVGGDLRSGETLAPLPNMQTSCGVLHRITPALVSTKGDKGTVRQRMKLTTLSMGGDCHMGRAFRVFKGTLQGKRCLTLPASSADAGLNTSLKCAAAAGGGDSQVFSFAKAQPFSLDDLVKQKFRLYRSDLGFLSTTASRTFPYFVGPAGIQTPKGKEEISFGMLYSASLKEMLASDLLYHCTATPNCVVARHLPTWTGETFMQDYVNGDLLLKDKNPFLFSSTRATLVQDRLLSRDRASDQKTALSMEDDLWNGRDWAWNFLNHSKPPVGKVDRGTWMRNRTAGCSASFERMLKETDPRLLQESVKRLTLCAPPPTGDLGTLCTAMTQHQLEIAQKNCQVWGKGDCIANVRMFYLPYMWSATNQEYSFNRVSDYYSDLLSNFFQNESYLDLCSSSTSKVILSTLASLSVQQNAICPASSLEVFKDMLSSLKTAGHFLLQMVYSYTMMVANVIASVFTIISGKDGTFYLAKAGEYMLDFFTSILSKLLMPLMDIVIHLLSTISPIGKVMAKLLNLLCMAYNWVMKEIIVQIWCEVVRGAVILILKLARALAFSDSNAVEGIQKILDLIGDGSASSCKAYYNANVLATCPSDNTPTFNINQFQPQPMATLCWANAGGGGVYTGATESLLSCTSSDTCAKDPLLFDDASKEGLVYCGSCPSTTQSNSLVSLRFGCDTYLQRCVCGVLENTKSECTKNSDCSVPRGAMCGVAKSMEEVRSSYVSVPCGSCGGMGMEPVCMIDGQGALGVCGCASVASNLLACASQQLGSRTGLTSHSMDMCAAVLDPFKVASIKASFAVQALSLDFGEIAIAFCALGGYQNLCMDVSIPLSATIGFVERPLVVLLQLLSIVTPSTQAQAGSGRRLLSQTDLLAQMHAPHDNHTKPIFNEWALEMNTECKGEEAKEGRAEGKQCLHWSAMAHYIVSHFNLSVWGVKQKSLFDAFQTGGVLGALWQVQKYAENSPGLVSFLMDLDPLTKTIQSTTRSLQQLHARSPWAQTFDLDFNLSFRQKGGRRLLSVTNLNSMDDNTDTDVNKGDWTFTCSRLQKPMHKILNAFWSTVRFYEGGGKPIAMMINQSSSATNPQPTSITNTVTNDNTTSDSEATTISPQTNCSVDAGLASCIGYSLPPPRQADTTQQKGMLEQLSAFTLYAPTLGFGGEQILDALLSPMDYQTAVEGDFITGKRILHDMGSCNYTQITLGGQKQRSFFIIFMGMALLFQLLSVMCIPLSCCQYAMWYFIFPILFFWAMYNTSPLCWPMIPTTFVHDMYLEITYFLPQDLKVPKFLVKPFCTLDGKLEDGSYDPSCFSSCSDPPFLFVSWQDSIIWWICEASTEQCVKWGDFMSSTFGPLFNDMASSSDYYASVIGYTSNDPEFVQAHRMCAFFSLYQVIFLLLSIVIGCYLIPSILLGIVEIFMGCGVLLLDAYIADG